MPRNSATPPASANSATATAPGVHAMPTCAVPNAITATPCSSRPMRLMRKSLPINCSASGRGRSSRRSKAPVRKNSVPSTSKPRPMASASANMQFTRP
jgi:hypothetical protein